MKVKLLFINPTLGLGGVERSLCDILRNFDYDKYDVDLLLYSNSGGLMKQLPENVRLVEPNLDDCYGRFVPIAKALLKKHQYAKLWLRLILSVSGRDRGYMLYLLRPIYHHLGKYDSVIAFREGDVTQMAYRAFQSDRVIGWWHYGGLPVADSEYKRLRRLTKLVAVSSNSHSALSEHFYYIKDRIVMIPNMVDTSNVCNLAREFMPQYQKQTRHVVTVARLSPEKHLENIIMCAKVMKAQGENIIWHILGEGLEYQTLLISIKENDLSDCVILEGGVSNPYPYVKHADLYVHPSYVESQGLTILEAMALGIPCVVTKSLGPCEFIRDGENGLLVEQGWEPLAQGVLRMLTDKSLYEKIKSNTHCPEQFAPESVMRKIYAMLDEK